MIFEMSIHPILRLMIVVFSKFARDNLAKPSENLRVNTDEILSILQAGSQSSKEKNQFYDCNLIFIGANSYISIFPQVLPLRKFSSK